MAAITKFVSEHPLPKSLEEFTEEEIKNNDNDMEAMIELEDKIVNKVESDEDFENDEIKDEKTEVVEKVEVQDSKTEVVENVEIKESKTEVVEYVEVQDSKTEVVENVELKETTENNEAVEIKATVEFKESVEDEKKPKVASPKISPEGSLECKSTTDTILPILLSTESYISARPSGVDDEFYE